MTVTELVNLMGTLSIGADNVTSGERSIFLQFLNLAHFELYQQTANFNEDLTRVEGVETDPATSMASLSQAPYILQTVYDLTQKKCLSRLSHVSLSEDDPERIATGSPTHYLLQTNELEIYPHSSTPARLSVSYIQQPTPFSETTPETDIPYPLAYHPVLADGALYYLFQQESGFRNTTRESAAAARWELGKARLLSYLYGKSPSSLSTFSNV